jgi:branched-chain amino acid transport system ATP-binding protein
MLLEVTDLDVFFRDNHVLRGISLNVNEGQLVAIVGSNGVGKTTLLRTISGFIRPRSGSICFLGKRIDGLRPNKVPAIGISHVPEGRRLFPYMKVLENLELGSYSKQAKKQKDESLQWVFNMFPILKQRQNQEARTLSGGEQQMLAIGRALMCRPKLLLLDEPSSGLAPLFVQKVFAIIEEIRSEGVSVLLVEQNVHSALELADHAYVLENGSIALQGPGKELLSDDTLKKTYLGL